MVEHAIVDQNMRNYNFFIYVDADFNFIYEPICIPLILYNILSLFIIDCLVTTLDTKITFSNMQQPTRLKVNNILVDKKSFAKYGL
jgi:hypothetical protein